MRRERGVRLIGWRVDDPPATCAVREARKGPQTIERVAALLNLTEEGVRAIEADGWRKAERLIDPRMLWRGRRVRR
jgi:hypothetical protein